jgi:hypothetical protein
MRSTSQTSTGLGLIVINCSEVAIFSETNVANGFRQRYSHCDENIRSSYCIL